MTTPLTDLPRVRVITISSRAAAGTYVDTAGPAVAEILLSSGFALDEVLVVPDGELIAGVLADAVADRRDLILTVGGTGIAPSDCTPEQTKKVIDREVPGIAEYVRAQSWVSVPSAVLSRGVSGVAGSSLIVNVPGSKKAAVECVTLLLPILGHALSQLRSEDHVRPADD